MEDLFDLELASEGLMEMASDEPIVDGRWDDDEWVNQQAELSAAEGGRVH